MSMILPGHGATADVGRALHPAKGDRGAVTRRHPALRSSPLAFHPDARPSRCYLLCGSTPAVRSWVAAALTDTGLAGHPEEYFHLPYQNLFLAEWGIPGPVEFETYLALVLQAGMGPSGVFGADVDWESFQALLGHLRNSAVSLEVPDDLLLSAYFPRLRYLYLIDEEDWVRNLARRGQHAQVAGSAGRTGADPSVQQRWIDYFDANAVDPVVLSYQELSDDRDTALERILVNLGVLEAGSRRVGF